MARDDDFEPRLGRIRSTKGGRSARYLQGVLRGVARATGSAKVRSSRFDGSRIGRGSGVGRVLHARDRHAAFRARRVIVQTRLIRLKATGANAARLHLRYLERDGVTREGLPGELYDARQDRAEGRDFVQRSEGDRHQFRFIVSTEDGAAYDDLKPFVRRLMEQMEKDLGTQLDWVAVDHYNTAHPHTHIVLRGKDDKGDDLIIAREYIAHGMRERAAEIVSLDLGPRTDHEIQSRLQHEVEQERFTSIDRELLRDANTDRLVQAANRDAFRQSIRAGRLQKLKRLALAEDVGSGLWRLEEGMEPTLRAMGERGDIIKMIHRELARNGVERSAANYAIHGDATADQTPIVGRVVARGLADELEDRYYLIVDGVDGRSHYVEIGQADVNEPTREGTIVAVSPRGNDARQVDRIIADIAKRHEGRYSADLHHETDPKASAPYIETHIRRLEDLRRGGAKVERHGDGSWTVPSDYLQQVKQIEVRRVQQIPVAIETLARSPIAGQTKVQGATWLDRELLSENVTSLRDSGFGREVRDALQQRRQWLVEQDLAHIEHDRVVYRAGLLTELRRRDLARAGAALAGEIGAPYAEAKTGSRIEGIYRRSVDLASGRFAVIEKSREFTLVPWRPVLERNIGKPVSGIMREGAISWTLGRQRSGPSVT
ncbi:MAG: relaxase/mobilization nuclease and DUF3363 domain-containing protein [Proteobacteria bacterium]|nr:relaxase/mobilization nuclease and DUF3363 domain-containing protein [Pseudomonadota bacterium]